jgi:glycosyltransferase involved in cell wall biosynthesis
VEPSTRLRPLWRFVLPGDPGRPASLYVRCARNARLSHRDGVVLGPDGLAQFDTYFNSLSIGRLLRHTTVRSIVLQACVSGAARLEIVHERSGATPVVVAASELCASHQDVHEVPVPPLDQLGDGFLFLRVTSLGPAAAISASAWCTSDQPARGVHLGVIVATYNRPSDVRENVARLAAALEEPAVGAMVDIIVVDNACNLDLGVTGRAVTVLPNRNTGGTGGFTRGLMHARALGRATHVLLMDDDVVFDPEIVFRTREFLAFARDPSLCIAGAMFDRVAPTLLFEAGAQFDAMSANPNRAPGQGLDLADWGNVMRAEEATEDVDYGAWWFFAFPIDLTRDNPLPMFLRGDDVCWGLLHAGRSTISLNGIGLWHEGFELKNGPVTWFYETRNFALTSILATPEYTWRNLMRRYLDTCGRSLVSLKYDSAERITLGVQELLRGPRHWLTLDQAALHERVGAFAIERAAPLGAELARVEPMRVPAGAGRILAALASIVTLGGHLLPRRFDRSPLRAVPIQHRVLGASPGHAAILYRDTTGAFGFVATRDRRRFLRLFGDMLLTAVRIRRRFERVRKAYRDAYPEMVSDDYWRTQFDARDVSVARRVPRPALSTSARGPRTARRRPTPPLA